MPASSSGRAPFLPLEEAAKVAGHCRWLENRLFVVLGSWVAAEPDAAVKALWSTSSLRHAAHAAGWHDRQPRVAHLDPEALTAPAGAGVASLLDALMATSDPGQTVARLVGVARVVHPRLLAAYRGRAERAHPLADGPTVRWTTALLADGEAAMAAAATLLHARLRSTGDHDAARTAEETLVALLPDGGDLIGLTSHAET